MIKVRPADAPLPRASERRQRAGRPGRRVGRPEPTGGFRTLREGVLESPRALDGCGSLRASGPHFVRTLRCLRRLAHRAHGPFQSTRTVPRPPQPTALLARSLRSLAALLIPRATGSRPPCARHASQRAPTAGGLCVPTLHRTDSNERRIARGRCTILYCFVLLPLALRFDLVSWNCYQSSSSMPP